MFTPKFFSPLPPVTSVTRQSNCSPASIKGASCFANRLFKNPRSSLFFVSTRIALGSCSFSGSLFRLSGVSFFRPLIRSWRPSKLTPASFVKKLSASPIFLYSSLAAIDCLLAKRCSTTDLRSSISRECNLMSTIFVLKYVRELNSLKSGLTTMSALPWWLKTLAKESMLKPTASNCRSPLLMFSLM